MRAMLRRAVLAATLAAVVAGCAVDEPSGTPPISPGTGPRPREVNLIARDWEFVPPIVDLVPGETIALHVINGGLETHEAIIGDAAVQDAWEAAEAATAGGPPGQTPAVSLPPDVAGVRIVVGSGEREDLIWIVPADPAIVAGLVIGCHIPGHWARGMRADIRIAPPRGS
jgi:hypothetical protein